MLVRIIEIPPPTGNFHFGKGERQAFVEVDWFRDEFSMLETKEGRAELTAFIEHKRYFSPSKAYLVLAQEHSFTINYSAP